MKKFIAFLLVGYLQAFNVICQNTLIDTEYIQYEKIIEFIRGNPDLIINNMTLNKKVRRQLQNQVKVCNNLAFQVNDSIYFISYFERFLRDASYSTCTSSTLQVSFDFIEPINRDLSKLSTSYSTNLWIYFSQIVDGHCIAAIYYDGMKYRNFALSNRFYPSLRILFRLDESGVKCYIISKSIP